MGGGQGRIVVATVACLLELTGCESSNQPGDLSRSTADITQSFRSGLASDPAATGGVRSAADAAPAAAAAALGKDPNDDLSLGKRHFRAANFDLAERHFRRAVELHPRDLESWIGLAACYDRLRRFDLADRAYVQAQSIAGPRAEILNNWGYSHMLRGDYRRAREMLLQAQAQDPANPYVTSNLELLRRRS